MSRRSRRSIFAVLAAGLAMLLHATVARADSMARLILHSEPGDWVGRGQDWDITYFGTEIRAAEVSRRLDNGDPAGVWFYLFEFGSNGEIVGFASLRFETDQLGIKIQPGFYPNAERITPSVALSRSALALTMAGFLPPISQMAGLGYSFAKFR